MTALGKVAANVMSWFSRMKGKSSHPEGKSGLAKIPTGKTPPGRSGLTLPATPKKRAKTPEQRAAELAAYRLAMRKHSACVAAIERERRIALGITSYEWVAVDVHGTCEVAKRNDGKVFSYDSPPKEGHVGEGECGSPDYCRCFAAPVVHGFS
jgi:hypothetical protein